MSTPPGAGPSTPLTADRTQSNTAQSCEISQSTERGTVWRGELWGLSHHHWQQLTSDHSQPINVINRSTGNRWGVDT